jgi:bla regulator protein BlaR1
MTATTNITEQLDRLAHTVLPILWRSSWQAAVLAGAVLMIQFALGKRLAPRWRHAMWWIVLLRLLIPVTPPSPFSLFNVAPEQPVAVDRGIVFIVQTLPQPLASSRNSDHHWILILAALWMIGLLWMLSRILCASVMLAIAVRRMTLVRDEKVLLLLDRCREELGVSRELTVLTSPMIGAPALMGFLRPRLLLPPTVLENFNPGELRLILLHELAHLKRHDVAINWLCAILHAVHWFNPIIYLAFARLRSDRELAADELVLSLTGDEQRAHYGDTLVKLLQTLSRPRGPALAGTVGILERAHPMRRRITMIAQFHRHAPRWTLAAAACLLILAALGLTDRVRGDAKGNSSSTAAATQPSVADMTTHARQMISEQRYDQALRLLNDILAADPGNEYAKGVLPLVKDKSELRHDAVAAASTTGPASDDDKLQALLQKRLPEVRFDAIGFSDVIDFLRDVTGANITVNWRALEAAGIDRNTPCTMRLKDVTFEQAMTHLLRDVGGGTVKLAFAVSDASVVVSTQEELAGRVQLRTYVVTDLLQEQDKGSAAALEQLIKQQVNGDMVVTAYHDRLLIKATPLQLKEVDAVLAELRKKP